MTGGTEGGRNERHRVWGLVALTGWGLGCIGVLALLGGEGPGGLLPYYQAVARHTGSEAALGVYALAVGGWGAAVEGVLRTVQPRITPRAGPVLAVAALAGVYAVSHMGFAWAGVVYAGLLGVGTGVFFHRTRWLGGLMLWHAAWDVGAVAFVVGSALTWDGPARIAVLDAYKREQVASGVLFPVAGWGWADRHHLETADVRAVALSLCAARGTRVSVPVEKGFERMGPGRSRSVLRYEVGVPADADRDLCLALSCAVFWDASVASEADQERAAWASGARLSAWSFEDLSSTLLSCDRAFGPEPMPDGELASALARWEIEGPGLLARAVRTPEDVLPEDPATAVRLRALTARMAEVSGSFTSSGD